MGNYGGKVAKSGYSYDDGDKRLVLNTAYPMLKIAYSGTGTMTLSGGYASKTILTHSLNYKPMFYFWTTYISMSTGSEVAKYRKAGWMEYAGLQRYDYYAVGVTTTTITYAVDTSATVDLVGGTGTDTLDYIYVVYYDPIS